MKSTLGLISLCLLCGCTEGGNVAAGLDALGDMQAEGEAIEEEAKPSAPVVCTPKEGLYKMTMTTTIYTCDPSQVGTIDGPHYRHIAFPSGASGSELVMTWGDTSVPYKWNQVTCTATRVENFESQGTKNTYSCTLFFVGGKMEGSSIFTSLVTSTSPNFYCKVVEVWAGDFMN